MDYQGGGGSTADPIRVAVPAFPNWLAVGMSAIASVREGEHPGLSRQPRIAGIYRA
ncbi:MAG: hypothetical protein AB9873_05330 [Syntrophobacteraceae bacterium]